MLPSQPTGRRAYDAFLPWQSECCPEVENRPAWQFCNGCRKKHGVWRHKGDCKVTLVLPKSPSKRTSTAAPAWPRKWESLAPDAGAPTPLLSDDEKRKVFQELDELQVCPPAVTALRNKLQKELEPPQSQSQQTQNQDNSKAEARQELDELLGLPTPRHPNTQRRIIELQATVNPPANDQSEATASQPKPKPPTAAKLQSTEAELARQNRAIDSISKEVVSLQQKLSDLQANLNKRAAQRDELAQEHAALTAAYHREVAGDTASVDAPNQFGIAFRPQAADLSDIDALIRHIEDSAHENPGFEQVRPCINRLRHSAAAATAIPSSDEDTFGDAFDNDELRTELQGVAEFKELPDVSDKILNIFSRFSSRRHRSEPFTTSSTRTATNGTANA